MVSCSCGTQILLSSFASLLILFLGKCYIFKHDLAVRKLCPVLKMIGRQAVWCGGLLCEARGGLFTIVSISAES